MREVLNLRPRPRGGARALVVVALLLAACGPQIGSLQRGEEGRVVRAFNGDSLELDSGLRVFLAEIDAPRGEQPYGAQAQGELEALALHREVLLAYGGAQRWVGRPREGETSSPPEAAIAHVYVKSEGGRWFWLQHELVQRGAAYVRPRRDNHARTADLMRIEARARAGERGLWGQRAYRTLNANAAAIIARDANASCLRSEAPFRIVEGRIGNAQVLDTRAALALEGIEDGSFELVLFGDGFTAWDGPALASLGGARIRARGPLGVFRETPQLCLDHASQLEVLVGD